MGDGDTVGYFLKEVSHTLQELSKHVLCMIRSVILSYICCRFSKGASVADAQNSRNAFAELCSGPSPRSTVENGVVHVKVGSVEHPVLPEHFIEWVSLQTKQGNQRKELHPGEKPEVCFALCEGDEVEAVYAYCNLHSLWKA